MLTAVFDSDLIQRYDGRGPRYTSYPTAVQFHEGFTADDYARMAAGSNGGDPASNPLSVYVHIPFCHSLCYYCGCHKIVSRHQYSADEYLDYLLEEIRLQGELFDRRRPVAQLHFGGGTPTFLTEAQFSRLMDGLSRHFNLVDDPEREYSIEIDPRSTDLSTLPYLESIGLNRLSLGVQDFDPEVQKTVNRVQSRADTLALVTQARAHGFGSVSVDLIYGLPLQTAERFLKTVDAVAEARPDRLAVYSYAHLPRMFRAQRLIREEQLPSGAEKLRLLQQTVERLTELGYEYIGMDHFALPEDDLVRARDEGTLHRNFQGYSTHADLDLVGLGLSAIGKVGPSYAQNLKLRKDYYPTVESGRLPVFRGVECTGEDLLRRHVIHALMCGGVADYDAIGERFGIDFPAHFADELARLEVLEKDGLVSVDDRRVTVTPKGWFLLRPIAMSFDAYLGGQQQGGFSKVI